MKLRLAKLISVLLGPQFWFPITLFLVLSLYSRNREEQIKIGIVLLIFQVVMPIVIFQTAKVLKIILSWDSVTRSRRIPLLSLCLFSYLLSLFLIRQVGNRQIFNLLFMEVVITIILIFFSFKWKISLHAALNAAGSIFINSFFGWQISILFLSIPLIIWSRYTLEKHSFPQLILGAVVGGTTSLILLKLVG